MTKPKELRKSLRNVVQEILPEVLSKELQSELNKALVARFEALEAAVNKKLQDIDSRHKDVMSMLLRQSTRALTPDKKD